jgi:hypothetical protein
VGEGKKLPEKEGYWWGAVSLTTNAATGTVLFGIHRLSMSGVHGMSCQERLGGEIRALEGENPRANTITLIRRAKDHWSISGRSTFYALKYTKGCTLSIIALANLPNSLATRLIVAIS